MSRTANAHVKLVLLRLRCAEGARDDVFFATCLSRRTPVPISFSHFFDSRWIEAQQMTVLNETKHLYQYFDAVAQVEYLYECMGETIEKDLREEIGFIKDTAVRSMKPRKSWTCPTNVHRC
jgi:hypothetical protein